MSTWTSPSIKLVDSCIYETSILLEQNSEKPAQYCYVSFISIYNAINSIYGFDWFYGLNDLKISSYNNQIGCFTKEKYDRKIVI